MFIIQRYIAQKKLHEWLRAKKGKDDSSGEKEFSPSLAAKSISCDNLQQETSSNSDIDWLSNSLKSSELRALRRSWRHLSGKQGYDKFVKLMVIVFEKTGQKNPKIHDLLTLNDDTSGEATTMYMHAKSLTALLNATLRLTGRLVVGTTPTIIGKLHAPLCSSGFEPDYWERFGVCFSEVMAKNDIVRATGSQKAWNIMIAVLTDRLRASFEQSARRYATEGVPKISILELEAMNVEDHMWRHNKKQLGLCQSSSRNSSLDKNFVLRSEENEKSSPTNPRFGASAKLRKQLSSKKLNSVDTQIKSTPQLNVEPSSGSLIRHQSCIVRKQSTPANVALSLTKSSSTKK